MCLEGGSLGVSCCGARGDVGGGCGDDGSPSSSPNELEFDGGGVFLLLLLLLLSLLAGGRELLLEGGGGGLCFDGGGADGDGDEDDEADGGGGDDEFECGDSFGDEDAIFTRCL